MSSKRGFGWMQALRNLPNDSSAKTLLVALGVSFVCALVISTAAVLLRPLQVANQERERERQILDMASRLPGIQGLLGGLQEPRIESVVIELATGKVVSALDPADFDPVDAGQDPEQSISLSPSEDLAGIGRRANFGLLHRVRQGDDVQLYILPVYGSGYGSTLYGYLALAGDANTVAALTFYQHGETPGIGSRIDSDEWKAQWTGKKVRDEQGQLRIDVAEEPLPPSSPLAAYQVDGITGATRTSRGVGNLLRFWLGDLGYGPYLERVRHNPGNRGGRP